LLYVPSLLHWVYGKNIGTEIIRMGTIEQAYNTDATIVRNEESLKSPFDGKYIPAILDGERVPANFRIASVFTGSSEKLRDELKDLDIRIIKAQQQKSDNEEFFSEDVVKIENEIYQKVKLLVSENDTNSLMKTKQIKDGIDELVQKKALIIGSSSTSDAFLKSLKEEKAKLQDKIKMNTKEIYSATAGVISYSVDGYESQLGPNVIRSMTPKFLNDIKSQLKQSSNVDNTIAAEKPFAKIIKDVEYYFVTVLDPDKAKLFRVDDVINVRVNDIGKVYDGVVDYKSEIQEGKCILSVKLDKGISDTAALRKTNVDLIKNYYQGLKVPVSCLRNIDLKEMKAEIILDKANYADVRSIKIIGKNEEWAVIESLKSSGAEGVSLYDIYVINPENIREGQMINE
ncbi:MAG: hypothetical protein N2484_09885, partial [Clostridia bacterium]|nr:hypothetical protein [Clostridia bacterium]